MNIRATLALAVLVLPLAACGIGKAPTYTLYRTLWIGVQKEPP